MPHETVAILIMLNNYFHDLAVAILFSSIFTAWVIWRRWGEGRKGNPELALEIVNWLGWLTRASLVWIVLGGIVRALAYRDYEWSAAAGNGQVLALMVKHVVLVATVIAGIALLIDLRRRLRPG